MNVILQISGPLDPEASALTMRPPPVTGDHHLKEIQPEFLSIINNLTNSQSVSVKELSPESCLAEM